MKDLAAEHELLSRRSLERTHKEFTSRIVLPAMGGITLIFHIMLFRPSADVFWMLSLLIPVTLFNIWVTQAPRVLKIASFVVDFRTDRADMLRWILNLAVADVWLFVVYDPPLSLAIPGWTMLMLSAQADLFQTFYRNVVVAVGYLAGAFLIFYVDPTATLTERIWGLAALAAVLFVFDRVEDYWLYELKNRKASEVAAESARRQAKAMEREALLAQQMRTVSHEVSNLLTVIEFATNDRQNFDDSQFERVRRSLQMVRRINDLVLKEFTRQPSTHTIAVRRVAEDLKMFIGKRFVDAKLELIFDLPDACSDFEIRERSGSLFLILSNLVKNAVTAALAKRTKSQEDVWVHVKFLLEAESLVVFIEDNGVGMQPAQLAALQQHKHPFSSGEGHGIGLRFVLDECAENGFKYKFDSKLGQGTIVELRIPYAAKQQPSVNS